ncbi:TPA: deoxyhypusine synthase [Candidatus Woesearchaeota archaeon]|nr:hypothetical protein [archaeon]HIJ11192.1 deoxyhypusine synthase [Candidatus Woesearchaeota archaeon]
MNITSKHGEGSHLIVDAFECDAALLNNPDFITSFLQEFPDLIDMTPITEPTVKNHVAENPDDSGITGFIIIAESHISIHTYPDRQFASIDIFSCREFDVNKAVEIIKEKFTPGRVERNVLHRGFRENLDAESFCEPIEGPTITKNTTVFEFMQNAKSIGFQATHLGQSLDVLRTMRKNNATIFMSFTSNMVSSGLREVFAQIVKEKLVDVIITSVGSIEEDLMKTVKPFLRGTFNSNDVELHKKGINRIGNIYVPDDRYEQLEDQLIPIFKQAYEEQQQTGKLISPSALIRKIGETVTDNNSILYWSVKNNIPIFCPAITDGALGLQLFFFKQKFNEFGIDTTADMKELASHVLNAQTTAGIILGGGVAKHHLIGINILREGLDYAIYVTTAKEGDGSLSGARPKEAKSWSKLKEDANNVCIDADATIVFPLIAIAMKEILGGRHE